MGSPQTDINRSWGSGWGVRLLDRLVARIHYEGWVHVERHAHDRGTVLPPAAAAARPRAADAPREVPRRGWRVVVQVGSEERLDCARCPSVDLSARTASCRTAPSQDGHAAAQPVWLTATDDNPNGATVRFLADGAEPANYSDYERDRSLRRRRSRRGRPRRARWSDSKAAGHDATYWQQDERGRWEKKA